MNLFLGVFVPKRGRPAIWDKENQNDTYLHLPELTATAGNGGIRDPTNLTQWYEPAMRRCLPFSLSESRLVNLC